MKLRPNSGFTLLEVAIVLVILGLLTGGVFAGRALIEAANVRSAITQLEKITLAADTFKNKYGYLPGDIPAYVTSRLGFFTLVGVAANTTGYGDGSGALEAGNTGGRQGYLGELNMFFRHLTDAGLIDGSYGTKGNAALQAASGGVVTASISDGVIADLFPRFKLGASCEIRVMRNQAHPAEAVNSYAIYDYRGIDVGGGGWSMACISGREIRMVDEKMDDGVPASGAITATGMGSGCTDPGMTSYLNTDSVDCWVNKTSFP